MKICAIQNCNFTPVFTSKDKVFALTSKADYFEVSQEQVKFNRLCDNIETTLGIVDETDVSQMAKQVSRAANVDIKEVYKTMLILSEYSSIKSLKQFEKYLNENDFKIISNILPYYNNPEITTPPCLSNVLHYISASNFNFYYDTNTSKNYKKALVIDSNFLAMLKNMPLQEYEQFKKDILQNKDVELWSNFLENLIEKFNKFLRISTVSSNKENEKLFNLFIKSKDDTLIYPAISFCHPFLTDPIYLNNFSQL